MLSRERYALNQLIREQNALRNAGRSAPADQSIQSAFRTEQSPFRVRPAERRADTILRPESQRCGPATRVRIPESTRNAQRDGRTMRSVKRQQAALLALMAGKP